MFKLPEGAVAVERIQIAAMPSIPCIAEHLQRYCFAATMINNCKSDDPPLPAVLDIACGTGYGSNLLANLPAIVIGVDRSADAIAEAKATHQEIENKVGEVHYEVCDDAQRWLERQPDRTYDHVVSFETLEHVDDMEGMIAELLRVTRRSLIISVPHNQPPGWLYHQTFEITADKLTAIVDRGIAKLSGRTFYTDMYGQTPPPATQVIPYFEDAHDLLMVIRARR